MSGKEKTENASEKTMVICISGLAGTGKITLAKKLAKKYALKYYSGGDALKALASEQGYDTSKSGWWESPEGLKFLERREQEPKFDQAVDEKLLEYAERGNILLDSWTMPWLLKTGFKIWLMASIEKRGERGAKKERLTPKEAPRVTTEKQ